MYLGWSAAEAGQALVCTDFDGKVKWRHKRGGFGGAALVAAPQGIVYVYDAGQGNILYRLDAAKGEYSNWQGTTEATLELGKVLAPFKPADAKQEPAASGLAVLDGKIFVSYGPLNAPWNNRQPSGNKLLVLDAATGRLLKQVSCENPGDLKTGADGKLYMVCGTTRIVGGPSRDGRHLHGRRRSAEHPLRGRRQAGKHLRRPRRSQNQVKVFDKAGRPSARSASRAGGTCSGPGNPTACDS